ncbi:MAG: helix-turn-helix domain-containing protein [Lachnospirales bacterium]
MSNLEIYKSSVSSKSVLIYNYLKTCSNENNASYPSIKTIALNTKLSVSSVKRGIEELCTNDFLEVKNRYRKNGGKSSNLYEILK